MLDELDRLGCRTCLVLTPLHPRLGSPDRAAYLQCLRDLVRDLAARHDTPVIDYLTFLGEEDFADASHPAESGRRKLSARLGRDLAPRLAD
jgi:hypothetical protein